VKFQKFLETMSKVIQDTPNIHLPTFKLIIKFFYSFLSNREKEKWLYRVNEITSHTTVQQTINKNLHINKIKALEKELNELKEVK